MVERRTTFVRTRSRPAAERVPRSRRGGFSSLATFLSISNHVQQDLPSVPSPLPIRRPSINPVHPFKASTLSSGSPSPYHHHSHPSHPSPSPSLRQSSPLSSPALSARPVQTSPTLSRVPLPSATAPGVGVGRPSPPFSPSSLGDRRSVVSAESGDPDRERDPHAPSPSPRTASTTMMPGHHRKRYSSSFGHRYAATGGAGSEGSAGSGERERERVAVSGLRFLVFICSWMNGSLCFMIKKIIFRRHNNDTIRNLGLAGRVVFEYEHRRR